ncbi:MAG TPA: hypothetical protein VLV54_00225 [Thermoanaerobaculia bacterium]|nr:hypothetical protein [Thermoanaerobaculia bacterium]
MPKSVSRLLRLAVLLVLCFAAARPVYADCIGTFATCAPGSPGCVEECNCSGSLHCCENLCVTCCTPT